MNCTRFVMPILLLTAATLLAQTPPSAPIVMEAKPKGLPPAVTNRAILLVNAANISDAQMESIRSFTQKDLWVKVETIASKTDWNALPAQMPMFFTSNRVVVIALGKGTLSDARIISAPDNGWAIVNVGPIMSLTDKQDHLLRQQTTRGIGFAIGVAECLDAHCSMRVSHVLADMVDAGQNYCPISRKEYMNLAPQKKLFPIISTRKVFKKPEGKSMDAAPAKVDPAKAN